MSLEAPLQIDLKITPYLTVIVSQVSFIGALVQVTTSNIFFILCNKHNFLQNMIYVLNLRGHIFM